MEWDLKLAGNRETVRTKVMQDARMPAHASAAILVAMNALPSAAPICVDAKGSYDEKTLELSMTVKTRLDLKQEGFNGSDQ